MGMWPVQAGGQQAGPAGIKAPGPLVGMHGPSLSSQEDRLECLHALHEGVVCFRGRTTLKKYLRGIGGERETELTGRGASPLVGWRRQLTWSPWESVLS